MSNKRARIREEKQKQKQKRFFTIMACAAVLAVIVLIFTVWGVDQYSKNYIMTFEGTKVGTGDFLFCSLFAGEAEDPKAASLEQLLTFMVLDKYAKENNLALTQEEKDEMLSYSTGLKSYYAQTYGLDLSFISDERMAELVGLDTLAVQLLDIYTADYQVNEADYEKALADYKQNNRVDYIETQVKYIFTSSADTIENARLDLEMGADFDEVVPRYSEYYDEETGVDTYDLKYLGLSDEDVDKVMALEVGGISEVVELEGLYGILCVDSITVPTDEEVNTLYRDKYITEQKEALFEEIIAGWKSSANYTINQKAYDAV